VLFDSRHTLCTLARNPGVAGPAILTLVLGMGANTAISAVFNGILRTPEVTPANSADGEIEMSPACPARPDVAQTLVSAAPRLISAFPALALAAEEGRDESLDS
jgi:hypothetical protein